jgi:hypothetical protein
MDRWHLILKIRRVKYQRCSRPFSQYGQRYTAKSGIADFRESKNIHSRPPRNTEILPPLSVMPTRMLLRSLMITWILSSPRLVSASLPIMQQISYSPSWFLNPDRNPVLHHVVRRIFYDHFCAGENEEEVKNTIREMKTMGFEGVILGYAKETLVHKYSNPESAAGSVSAEDIIEIWKRGTLETLAMLGAGDFLAIKYVLPLSREGLF